MVAMLILSFFAVCLTTGRFAYFMTPEAYGSPTTVQVSPINSTGDVGQTVRVNVTISDVANLTGWEFKLFFLNSILNCTGVTEGTFLKNVGGTFPIIDIVDTFNSTHGRILAACVLTGSDVTANGSGDLAEITFKAIGPGDTALHLQDVKLSDEKNPAQPIPKIVVDGTAHVNVPPEQVLDVYTQRGGTGVNVSSDAFAPGETISFNASLIYLGAPVPGTIVQFLTYDPHGTPTARTAITGSEGIATLNVTLPSDPLSGKYLTIASASVYGNLYNDTIDYRVGRIINIIQTVTCNCTGFSQTQFPRGTLAYVNITLENISFNTKHSFILLEATDEITPTIAQDWISYDMPSGQNSLLLGFRIPSWVRSPTGQVYVGVYDGPPWSGGSAYCSGSYLPLSIVGG